MPIFTKKTKTGVSYMVRVKDPFGRWFPAKTFSRKVDARKHERHLLAQKDKGTQAIGAAMARLRFEEFWIIWRKECRLSNSDGWRQTQQRLFEMHIQPFLGKLKVSEIRQREIAQVLGRLHEKNYSSQQIAHVYNTLHSVFHDAIEHFEFLQANPVKLKLKPKIAKRERDYWTHDVSWDFMTKTKEHWLAPAIWVSLLSGLRPCEVIALQWDQVEFQNRRILISRSHSRKENRIKNCPKQDDWGSAPMPPILLKFLKELKERRGEEEGFVARCARGGMLTYHSFYGTLKKLCKDLGFKQLSPHELRHSCTDIYYTQGAGTEDLRRLLNHSKTETTLTYIHRTEERLGGIAGSINPPPKSPVPKLKLVK